MVFTNAWRHLSTALQGLEERVTQRAEENSAWMRRSVQLVKDYHGSDEWVPVSLAVGNPSPIILPIETHDPAYAEWTSCVECLCIVSRTREDAEKGITYPDPPQEFPVPKGWKPAPLRTHCVFWYLREAYVVLDAVEIFLLSQEELPGGSGTSAMSEILRRLTETYKNGQQPKGLH